MEKNNKKGILYIIIGGVTIILMAIVCFFNADLFRTNNNGNKKSELNIELTSAELDTVNSVGYVDATPDISINNASFELNVSLKNPGDVVIYNIELVNKDDNPGILYNTDSILNVTGKEDVLKNIEYSIVYADGASIKNGDVLPAASDGKNTSVYMKLTVKYKEDGAKMDTDTNINIKGELLYKEK